MKSYKFELIIKEGSDEFWEDITADGKTGCDEVLKEIKTIFDENFWDVELKLTGYKDAD